jgi:hypothetical protein
VGAPVCERDYRNAGGQGEPGDAGFGGHWPQAKAWQQMRAERAAFVEYFGRDELVLPPAKAEERVNAFYRHRQEAALAARPARRRPSDIPGVDVPAFELPAEIADASTIGVIYDEIDGLNFYNEYGMLRDLFAYPALASDQRYVDLLRGRRPSARCLFAAWPLPTRRRLTPCSARSCASRISPGAEHGEALLRRRKPWYCEHEPRPNRTVIGARLSEPVGW